MAQLFRSGADTIARIALVAIVVLPLIVVGAALVLVRSGTVTGQNRTVHQPVPFSHRHHTAEIGIDCRYCHTSVETSAHAGLPPTTTCMSCHSQLFTDARMLEPVRQSLARHQSLSWNAVNALPGYVYFNHSVHIAGHVACGTCHGAVGTMNLTRQNAPLTMQWCLDCHRDPGPRLSKADRLFDPFFSSESSRSASIHVGSLPLKRLTDCSTCHR